MKEQRVKFWDYEMENEANNDESYYPGSEINHDSISDYSSDSSVEVS